VSLKAPRVVRKKTSNHCAGEDQQHFKSQKLCVYRKSVQLRLDFALNNNIIVTFRENCVSVFVNTDNASLYKAEI
jgi:hypothetical protein